MVTKSKRYDSTEAFRGIVGGTLSLTLSSFAVKVLGLIYKIPISRILSDEGMGYFNSAYAVFGLFYLLCTAGVPKAIMILCSDCSDDVAPGRKTFIVKTAMKTFFYIGFFCTTSFLVLAFPIARLIGNSDAAFTMLSIAPSILFVAIGGVVRGYLSSRANFFEIAVAGIIEGVAKLALGLIFANIALRLGLPLKIIASMTIFGTTIGAIFSFAYLYKCSKKEFAKEKTGRNCVFASKSKIIRKIFKISVPITLSSAVMSLTNIIDLALIMRRLKDSGYSEAEASAFYGNYTTLAVSMFNFALSIITPISIIFLPRFTKALSEKNYADYTFWVDKSLKTVAFFAAPLTFGLSFYAMEILSLIFGKSAAVSGAALLVLISPAIILSSLVIIVNTTLEAEGMMNIPIYSMLAGGIVKILIAYFLIINPEIGIYGAPIGTVASYAMALFVSLIFSLKSRKKQMHILSASLPSYLLATVSVISSKIIYNCLINTLDWRISFVIAVAFCALVYIGFSAIFGLLKKDKIVMSAKYTNFA